MAIKTFNPNRTVGGTFSLVRAADGTYSVKENGFESLGALQLPDLSATAVTPDTPDTPETTDPQPISGLLEDQTKQAFELPKPGDDKTQADRDADLFQRATDLSSNLETVSDKQKQESQLGLGRDRINPFRNIDTGVGEFSGTGIRAPDRIFRDESNLSGYGAQVDQLGLKDPKLETTTFKKSRVRGPKDFKDKQKSEVTRAGDPDPDTQDPMLIDAQSQTLGIQGTPQDIEKRQQGQLGSLGIGTPQDVERRQQGQLGTIVDEGAVQLGEMNTTTAKKTFSESINTALKGFKTPMMALVEGVANIGVSPAQQRLNSLNKSSLAAAGYKTRGELGSSIDPGRIAGNPADNVFAGMNAQSARGNIMTASRNRIDTINNSAAKARAKGDIAKAERMEAKANKFESQRNEMLAEQEKKQAEINKATMNQGPPGQDDKNAGGKSIVCTAMYQTTGLQDWAKAMKIWYIYQKKYLTIQHQEGYHKLFKPFVKGMHKSNIIKAIGAHFAKHRTQHLKHIMFNSKPSLLGKIYNKILEPICYWAGKK